MQIICLLSRTEASFRGPSGHTLTTAVTWARWPIKLSTGYRLQQQQMAIHRRVVLYPIYLANVCRGARVPMTKAIQGPSTPMEHLWGVQLLK